ncbi:MAG: alpha/beta hydrolase [Bacteroidota bacterium]
MSEKTVTSEQGTVHYWVGGQGSETLVFTHGATMDHALFNLQLPYFQDRYRIVTWDVPAHGCSRPYAGFSLKTAAQILVQILDEESISQVHLIGQSMGGYISQIVTVDYPDRVSSFCSVGASPLDISYYSRLDRWLLSIAPALLQLYPYSILVNSIAKQVSQQPESEAYARRVLSKLTKNEVARIMRVVYEGVIAYSEQRIRLTCPILITYGEMEKSGKVKPYCQRWAKEESLPLVVIPEAAHNANLDNAAAFNQVLDNFLQRVTEP